VAKDNDEIKNIIFNNSLLKEDGYTIKKKA
jgi:hypothetical protein